ncbi:hypothetical protein SH668x_002220 [Planctomicrobium sp. SH668]|uniref:hypothetical protein n=1 Tax=Planctomicrobium sp. SH668 TaxID=3448126 RepID=UPI003F5B2741
MPLQNRGQLCVWTTSGSGRPCHRLFICGSTGASPILSRNFIEHQMRDDRIVHVEFYQQRGLRAQLGSVFELEEQGGGLE